MFHRNMFWEIKLFKPGHFTMEDPLLHFSQGLRIAIYAKNSKNFLLQISKIFNRNVLWVILYQSCSGPVFINIVSRCGAFFSMITEGNTFEIFKSATPISKILHWTVVWVTLYQNCTSYIL